MCADKFTQKESEKPGQAKVRFGTGASGPCMDKLFADGINFGLLKHRHLN